MTSPSTTAKITTVHAAIEAIATTILERNIPGIHGADDYENWTCLANRGQFRAEWRGLESPDLVDAKAVVELHKNVAALACKLADEWQDVALDIFAS